MGLIDVGIYSRDGPSKTDIEIVNLHQSKGTQWVVYINGISFDPYGCAPPQILSKFIRKRNEHCLYSEYKIQYLTIKKDSFCASFYLYKHWMTKVLGIDFKIGVLNLYYQRNSYINYLYRI